MKKLVAFLLVAVMVLSFAACGQDKASSDLASIKDKGELVVGMTLFAPMDYYDSDNELTGFEVEFGKAVAEKLGVTPKFVEINWDTKETELSSGNIDCIWNGLTITDERKENMSISTPYLSNKQVMVTKAENVEKYSADVASAKIVAEAGSAGEELATGEEFFTSAEFTAVDSQAKALMEVASGTADIAIVDYVTSIGSIGEGTDYADLSVVSSKEFSPEEYGIAFRKGSDVTEEVNKIIDELANDGTLKKIADKYKLGDLLLVK